MFFGCIVKYIVSEFVFSLFFEVNLWTKKRFKKHENYDNNLQKVYDFSVVDI